MDFIIAGFLPFFQPLSPVRGVRYDVMVNCNEGIDYYWQCQYFLGEINDAPKKNNDGIDNGNDKSIGHDTQPLCFVVVAFNGSFRSLYGLMKRIKLVGSAKEDIREQKNDDERNERMMMGFFSRDYIDFYNRFETDFFPDTL